MPKTTVPVHGDPVGTLEDYVVGRRAGRSAAPVPVVGMPRDVEAVEAVITALDRGVADDLDAHRTMTSTLVSELGLDYGAVWLPGSRGTSGSRGSGVRSPRRCRPLARRA